MTCINLVPTSQETHFIIKTNKLILIRRNDGHSGRRSEHIDVMWGEGDVEGKALPLQAWRCPEGSRKLRFQDFMTTAQNGGKVVNLTLRPPLPPGNAPGTHFC